jgi:hypothetical protein
MNKNLPQPGRYSVPWIEGRSCNPKVLEVSCLPTAFVVIQRSCGTSDKSLLRLPFILLHRAVMVRELQLSHEVKLWMLSIQSSSYYRLRSSQGDNNNSSNKSD